MSTASSRSVIVDLLFGGRALIRDQLAECGLAVVLNGLVEARRHLRDVKRGTNLLDLELRGPCQLLDRRLALELIAQPLVGACDLALPGPDVDREPDHSGRVSERALDCLPDPDRRVRRELVATPPVEFSDARISPNMPSWIRSWSGRPRFWYFRAFEITSRRLELISVSFASRSPRSIACASSTSCSLVEQRVAVRAAIEEREPIGRLRGLEVLLRYFLKLHRFRSYIPPRWGQKRAP